MEQIKKLIANNKKLVAIVLVALVGLAGVKLAPETADSLASAIVEACCHQDPTP